MVPVKAEGAHDPLLTTEIIQILLTEKCADNIYGVVKLHFIISVLKRRII